MLASFAALAGCGGGAGGLPVLGQLPAFAFTDQAGRRFGSAELQGRAWVADFIFTTCGGICPAMTARMARLQAEAPASARFVSFSVDPRTDSPEALARYAGRFHARPGWHFLTGPAEELYALSTEHFKLEAFEVPPGDRRPGDDGPFLHSSKFVLIDAALRIRGYYDSSEPSDLARLSTDLARLAPSAARERLAWLPGWNAVLNATSACLLLAGFALIRRGRRRAHAAAMLSAVFASALFLGGYLYYHAHVGSVRFMGQGTLRTAYFAILVSHSLLAALTLPLVLLTLARALRGRFDAHRAIARRTLPVWLYVSLTGVLVYWMLYRI